MKTESSDLKSLDFVSDVSVGYLRPQVSACRYRCPFTNRPKCYEWRKTHARQQGWNQSMPRAEM